MIIKECTIDLLEKKYGGNDNKIIDIFVQRANPKWRNSGDSEAPIDIAGVEKRFLSALETATIK